MLTATSINPDGTKTSRTIFQRITLRVFVRKVKRRKIDIDRRHIDLNLSE